MIYKVLKLKKNGFWFISYIPQAQGGFFKKLFMISYFYRIIGMCKNEYIYYILKC